MGLDNAATEVMYLSILRYVTWDCAKESIFIISEFYYSIL